MQLTERCYSMASYLVFQNSPVTVKEIARKFNISERTVRYDLDVLEEWFDNQGIILERKSKVGIYINKNNAEFLELKNTLNKPAEVQQIYSSKERRDIIRGLLLDEKKVYTLLELGNKVNVSKSTVINDLNEVEKWFEKYNVKLIRKSNFGIKIQCDEDSLRKAVVNHMYEIYNKDDLLQLLNLTKVEVNKKSRISNIAKNEILGLFENIDIERLEICINGIEMDLNTKFTDAALVGLLVHLGLVINRIKMKKEIIMPMEELENLRMLPEFKVSEKALKEIEKLSGVEFPDDEIGYFTIHILGSSIKKKYSENDGGIVKSIEKVVNVIKEMLVEISRILDVDLTSDQELLEGLLLHIKPAISRIKFQIYLANPILSDIRLQFGRIFDVVKSASKILETHFECLINDDEIGYITMHIGAAVQRSKKEVCNKYVNAIVVCSSGVGTAKLLSARIKNEFGQVNIVHEMSYLEFGKFDKSSIDVIFTTIPVNEIEHRNVIHVTALLTKEDKGKISVFLKMFLSRNENGNRFIGEMFSIIEKNCVVLNEEKLKKDLEGFLFSMKKIGVDKVENELCLKDLLTKGTIKVDVLADNWSDAVYAGGKILVNQGFVNQDYVKDMISNVIKFKSHIVIAPGIAMPHAMPNGNVSKVSMSLTVLKNPVKFGHPFNDPVSLIICLAPMDGVSHVKPLFEFIELIEDKEKLEMIFNAKNESDILKALFNSLEL